MEILAELLLSLLGFVAEIGLQFVLELLANAGWRVLREPFRPAREVSRWLAGLGYTVYGAAVGAISLWPFPEPWLHAPWARVANLALAPLACGLAMAWVGSWRRQRGDAVMRLDRFSYGTLFARAMALVRFRFAELG